MGILEGQGLIALSSQSELSSCKSRRDLRLVATVTRPSSISAPVISSNQVNYLTAVYISYRFLEKLGERKYIHHQAFPGILNGSLSPNRAGNVSLYGAASLRKLGPKTSRSQTSGYPAFPECSCLGVTYGCRVYTVFTAGTQIQD